MLHHRALVAGLVPAILSLACLSVVATTTSAHAKPATADAKPATVGATSTSAATARSRPAKAMKASSENADSRQATAAEGAAPGRPMKATDLRQLYGGKTWVWPNGGGYMDPSGRFVGVAGKDYVRGTWQASDNGRMCFGGTWTSGGKRSEDRTCFSHRSTGDTIYQRKDPSGAWYAFKHDPVRGTDEFSKLVQGDQVSDQVKQIQAVLSAD